MKKHLKKAIFITALAVVLTGCQADKVEPSNVDENTQVEETKPEKNINVTEELENFIAGEPQIVEVRKFIEDNIGKADRETADKMIHYLIDLQRNALEAEIDNFYSEANLDIHAKIIETYEKDKSKFEKASVFIGDSKYQLVNLMDDKNMAKVLKDLFDKGYGLYNAEGSYYPVIDYRLLKGSYIGNVTDMTAEYLDIMSDELDESTLVEEYLAIDFSELKDRAFRYEEFLMKYPKSPYTEDVMINYMVCIWKLVNPNIFDGMLDDDFKVVSEVNEVYESILADESHPVTYEAVKGITAYIESKDGVLGSMNNMDELFKISDKLHKEAAARINEMYLGE